MKMFIQIVLIATISVLVFIPIFRKLGVKYGIVDNPLKIEKDRNGNTRKKLHKSITPLTGGLALFVSFWIAAFFTIGINTQIIGIFLGSLFIVVIMGIDDKYDLRPGVKLLAQFIAAGIPILFGVQIRYISNPSTGIYFDIGLWGVLFSLIWCVAFMNAMNLIDGLDGLASGIAGIAGLAMFTVAYLSGFTIAALLAVALSATSFAFLKFNFYPASIFLGDSGAHFLGYMIAMISIWAGLKTTSSIILLIALVGFGIPIFDVIFSSVTRARKGKKIYEADLENIHYQLHQKKGWGQRRIAVVFYLITAVLCLIPILLLYL
ncbi:MAG: undecaprenyl/decaprenyl-phosphate alpha-N-acetylglucosaminyl 1-phosphate transferase [Caldisericia bacterium]|nr:undecaprenyl/decaprenyl-phosphate alpha-N-acetylglucosaminyl 1-phosphate transferase [Caldisericia bacterium]